MHYVYIVTNTKHGSLYIGTTRNLEHRVWEHKTKRLKGFTEKYNCSRLVFYEEFDTALEAVQREKNMKVWKRDWKIRAIEELNPNWSDLSESWYSDLQ